MRWTIGFFVAALVFTAAASAQTEWTRKPGDAGFVTFDAVGGTPDRRVAVIAAPPVPAEGALEPWLATLLMQSASALQGEATLAARPERGDGFLRRYATIRRSDMTLETYAYAYETGGQRRLIQIVSSGAGIGNAFAEAQALVKGWASRQEMGPLAIGGAAPAPTTTSRGGVFGPTNVGQAHWLRPDSGVGDAAVHRVSLETGCSMGLSGVRCGQMQVYLFLKDGRVYQNVSASPRDFDPEAARGEITEGRWRPAGSGADITWMSGSRETVEGPLQGVGAGQGVALSGTFAAHGNYSSGVSVSRFTFGQDGTFVERGAMALTNASSATDGGAGRYRAEGFTLRLAYNDGRMDNRLLAITAVERGQPYGLLIGDQLYGRE